MTTFGDLRVGDKIYVISHECYDFEPLVGTITKIVKTYDKGNKVHMLMDTKDIGSIEPEIENESESISWDGFRQYDIFADKELMSKRLLSHMRELSNFCFQEL